MSLNSGCRDYRYTDKVCVPFGLMTTTEGLSIGISFLNSHVREYLQGTA